MEEHTFVELCVTLVELISMCCILEHQTRESSMSSFRTIDYLFVPPFILNAFDSNDLPIVRFHRGVKLLQGVLVLFACACKSHLLEVTTRWIPMLAGNIGRAVRERIKDMEHTEGSDEAS